MTLYPNPANDRVFVNLGEETSQAGKIEVLDMGGKVVHVEELPPGYQLVRMDIAQLNRGMYVLRWMEGDQIRGVNKMVKTR